MTPLPYALLDRLCELAASLDPQTVAAIAELLRSCPNAGAAASAAKHARLLLPCDAGAMLDIAVDTWRFVAPQTSGAEIGAALIAAAAQAERLATGSFARQFPAQAK